MIPFMIVLSIGTMLMLLMAWSDRRIEKRARLAREKRKSESRVVIVNVGKASLSIFVKVGDPYRNAYRTISHTVFGKLVPTRRPRFEGDDEETLSIYDARIALDAWKRSSGDTGMLAVDRTLIMKENVCSIDVTFSDHFAAVSEYKLKKQYREKQIVIRNRKEADAALLEHPALADILFVHSSGAGFRVATDHLEEQVEVLPLDEVVKHPAR